jgi:ParB family chromosome partitioning protein
MTLQTIALSQLVPSQGNPRRAFDAASLEGLAVSIRTDGLLQNLVVRPSRGKSFAIISGERRYRALKLLEERGELPEGFTVPVEVRAKLSKDDSLRLAMVENLQRADLTPLEQTEALTRLVKDGEKLDTLIAQTGLSATTIKRRLALNGLCKEAREALESKTITLAQAEALTLGSAESQRDVLDDMEHRHWVDADGIRERLTAQLPCVADAIFPLERYTGTITTDLFAEGDSSFFDDVEQFDELQREAVNTLADHHRASAAWVEVTEDWQISTWPYDKAKEGERSGVLINLSPRGTVEVRENLVRKASRQTVQTLRDNPIAPKPKASYATPLRRMLSCHKSMAVQEMLLSAPRVAKELAAVRSFVELETHTCIGTLSREEDPQGAYRILETEAKRFAAKLDLAPEQGDDVWSVFPPCDADDVAIYRSLKNFSDHDLEAFQILLTALSFGQEDCDRFDTKDSLFNVLAQDLNISMRNHWRPDRSFFEKRTRDQLVSLAKECGFAEGRSCLASYKKSELVSGLAKFFADAQSEADPSEAQEKARAWLPEIMLFPAVDPDKVDAPDETDAQDDEADDERADADESEDEGALDDEDDEIREAA